MDRPIKLNQITNRRASLTFAEAVWVWERHFAGEHNHIIAAKLGINQGRVSEVLTEALHKGAVLTARRNDLFDRSA